MENQSLVEIEYSELWNIAPEWANFFGINDNGVSYWYEKKPHQDWDRYDYGWYRNTNDSKSKYSKYRLSDSDIEKYGRLIKREKKIMKQSITSTEYTTSASQTGVEVTTNVKLKFLNGVETTISVEEAKQLMQALNQQLGNSQSFPVSFPRLPGTNAPYYENETIVWSSDSEMPKDMT